MPRGCAPRSPRTHRHPDVQSTLLRLDDAGVGARGWQRSLTVNAITGRIIRARRPRHQ
jgi:hypothetical protein